MSHLFIHKQLEGERVSSAHQPLKYNKIISVKGIRQDKDRTLSSDRKKRLEKNSIDTTKELK